MTICHNCGGHGWFWGFVLMLRTCKGCGSVSAIEGRDAA